MGINETVVVVTGAAGNLGMAVCRRFARDGAKLVMLDLERGPLQQAQAQLGLGNDQVQLAAADITDPQAVLAAVAEAVGRFGRLDALANIAGGFSMGPAVHETSLETWRHLLDLNATSVLVLAQAVVPVMLRQGRGRIVNVAARAALKGEAHMAAYCVAKAAVIRLTESMAGELRDQGITANCVLPSIIDTPQNRAAMPDATFDRWVAPSQLAEVIAFLCSDAAAAVSGAAIPVYGRA